MNADHHTPGTRRRLVAVTIGTAAVAAGLTLLMPHGTSAQQRAATGPLRAGISAPRVADAARLQVLGGTNAERAAVRRAVALMGGGGGIAEVRISSRHTVAIRVFPDTTADNGWAAQVTGQELLALMPSLHVTVDGAPAHRTRPIAVRTLLARVRKAATASPIAVTRLRVYPVTVGAVAVTARMSVEQILADRLSDMTALHAVVPSSVSAAYTVLAPNGTVLGRSGTWGNGGVSGNGDPEPVSPAIPGDLTGPTHLDVTFTNSAGATTRTDTLDCNGGATTVAAPQRSCAALDHDWLRYLPPSTAALACGGGGAVTLTSVTISGTFHGVSVHRTSATCPIGPSPKAWDTLLTLDPAIPTADGVAAPDTAGAAALPITGDPRRLVDLVRATVADAGGPGGLSRILVHRDRVDLRAPVSADASPEFGWRLIVLRDALKRRASDAGIPMRIPTVHLGRMRFGWAHRASTNRRSPEQLVRLVRDRLAGSPIQVRAVTALPLAIGVVRLDAVMTPRQVLEDDMPDAMTLQNATPPDVNLLVHVTTTDGTPLWENGRAVSGEYHLRFDPPPAVSPALPSDLTGPTRVVVRIGAAAPKVLDCDGGHSTVRDPATACAALTAHWLTFLPPQALASTCHNPGVTERLLVTGTFHGVTVSRSNPMCGAGATIAQWRALLR